MGITLEEWTEWKLQPVTVEFFKAIENRVEGIKDDWANGHFTVESVEGTKQLNAKALGNVEILLALLETSYEGVVEDAADARYNK